MDKNLNDVVDGFFKGIVFILFSFAASVVTVLRQPARGAVKLLRRLHAKDIYQVRPYVFLFLSFCLFRVEEIPAGCRLPLAVSTVSSFVPV